MINLVDIAKKVTSPFGYRGDIGVSGASRDHKGIDVVLNNDNIPAVMGGVVTDSGYNSARGNYITIQQTDGTTATYMHMAAPSIYKRGSVISEGDVIGKQGSTGISSGKHLHYEVKDSSGTYLDPKKYMSGTLNVGRFDSDSVTGTGFQVEQTGTKLSGIMGTIVNIVAMLILVMFAAYLFIKAFDIKII